MFRYICWNAQSINTTQWSYLLWQFVFIPSWCVNIIQMFLCYLVKYIKKEPDFFPRLRKYKKEEQLIWSRHPNDKGYGDFVLFLTQYLLWQGWLLGPWHILCPVSDDTLSIALMVEEDQERHCLSKQKKHKAYWTGYVQGCWGNSPKSLPGCFLSTLRGCGHLGTFLITRKQQINLH